MGRLPVFAGLHLHPVSKSSEKSDARPPTVVANNLIYCGAVSKIESWLTIDWLRRLLPGCERPPPSSGEFSPGFLPSDAKSPFFQ